MFENTWTENYEQAKLALALALGSMQQHIENTIQRCQQILSEVSTVTFSSEGVNSVDKTIAEWIQVEFHRIAVYILLQKANQSLTRLSLTWIEPLAVERRRGIEL